MPRSSFNMIRLFLLSAVLTAAALGVAGTAFAVLDPPHSRLGSCSACHNNAAQNVASYGSIDNSPLNLMCMSCHGVSAPEMITHSSRQAINYENNRFGPWTWECVDCHNPHNMDQARRYPGTYASGGSALYNGLVATVRDGAANRVAVKGPVTSLAADSLVGYIIEFGTGKALSNSGTYYIIAHNNGDVITVADAGTFIKSPYVVAGHSYAISNTVLIKTVIDRGYPVVNSEGVVIGPEYPDVKYFNTAGAHSGADAANMTTSLCVVCHTKTEHNNIGYEIAKSQPGGSGNDYNAAYANSASYAHPTSNGASCSATECHYNAAGGLVVRCTQCHGYFMLDNGGLVNTDGSGNSSATGVGSVFGVNAIGAHPTHLVKYGEMGKCDICHTGGMYDSGLADSYIDIGFNATTAGMSAPGKLGTGYFSRDAAAWGITNGYAVIGMANIGGDNGCESLYCHSNGMPIDASTIYRPKNWFTGTTVCDSCHGDKADPSTMSTAHSIHLVNGTIDSGITCYNCHHDTVSTAKNSYVEDDLAAGTKHVNGTRDIVNGGSFDNASGISCTVSFIKVSGGDGVTPTSCSTVSCHSGTGIGDPSITATWSNSSSSDFCSLCHSDIYGRMHGAAAHKHNMVLNASDADAYPSLPDTSCLQCHEKHSDRAASGNGRSFNLRLSNTAAPSAVSNTDYHPEDASGGICLSCHQDRQAGNGVALPPIPKADAVANGAVHMYAVGSTFKDGSQLGAVCVKCHSENGTATSPVSSFGAQTGTFKFAPHQGPQQSLLINNANTNPDAACIMCHTSGTDYYNNLSAPAVSALLNSGAVNNGLGAFTSGHPVGGAYAANRIVNSIDLAAGSVNPASGRFVSCADCHNVHATQRSPRSESGIVMGDQSDAAHQYLTDAKLTLANTAWGADRWKGYLIVMTTASGGGLVDTRFVRQVTGSTTDGTGTKFTFGLPFTDKASYVGLDWKYEVRKLDGSADLGTNGAWGVQVVYADGAAKATAPANDTFGLNYTGAATSSASAANSNTVIGGTFSATQNLRGMTLFANSGPCGPATTVVGGQTIVTAVGSQYAILDSDATSVTVPGITGCTPAAGAGTTYQILDLYNNVLDSGACDTASVSDPSASQKLYPAQPVQTISTGNAGCADSTKNWVYGKWAGYKFHWTGGACANKGQDEIVDWSLTNAVAFSQKTTAKCAMNAGDAYLVAGTVVSDNFVNPVPGADATYTKVANAANQRDVCMKCHSYYAFGNTDYPALVSGGPSRGNFTWEGTGTDIALEFNPNNLAHHAVYAVGKNQPLPTDGSALDTVPSGRMTLSKVTAKFARQLNPQWFGVDPAIWTWAGTASGGVVTLTTGTLPNNAMPGWYVRTSGGNWYQITQVTDATHFNAAATNGNPWDGGATPIPDGSIGMVTAGLGDTFVPPYGPWAQINCSDCHGGTPEDPQGPHVSANRWIMKEADAELRFEGMDTIDTAGGHSSYNPGVKIIKYGQISYTRPGAAGTVPENDDTELLPQYVCYNCHRADVYGTAEDEGSSNSENFSASGPLNDFNNLYAYKEGPRNNKLSRQPHGASVLYGTAHCQIPTQKFGTWGIFCKNCHLGERMGAVHGTNGLNNTPDSSMSADGNPDYDSNPIGIVRATSCVNNGTDLNTSCAAPVAALATPYGGDHSLIGFSMRFNEDTANNCYATTPAVIDNIGNTIYFKTVDKTKLGCTPTTSSTFNLYDRGLINPATGDYTGVTPAYNGTCDQATTGVSVCNTSSLADQTVNKYAGYVLQYTNGACNGINALVTGNTKSGSNAVLAVGAVNGTLCVPRSGGYPDDGLVSLSSVFGKCTNSIDYGDGVMGIYNCVDVTKNFGGASGDNALVGQYIAIISLTTATATPACLGQPLRVMGNLYNSLLVNGLDGNGGLCNVAAATNYSFVGANRTSITKGGHISKNQGKRFLNGGGWSGWDNVNNLKALDRAGTNYQGACYVTAATNNNVSNCGSAHGADNSNVSGAVGGHGGFSTYANPATYDYDAN